MAHAEIQNNENGDNDDSFDLQGHLEDSGFNEHVKIKDAINNADLTMNDILDCDKYEYNAVAQRNRFIKASYLNYARVPETWIGDRFQPFIVTCCSNKVKVVLV